MFGLETLRDLWAIKHSPSESTYAPSRGVLQSNKDLDPKPPEQQTWSAWQMAYLWSCNAINIGTMEQASSLVTLGLSYREAIPCIVIGNILCTLAITANAATGTWLHVPFAVLSRASFGVYGAWFPIVSRMLLALIC
jgi:NCS1 family nucleobase:cation symporter-1